MTDFNKLALLIKEAAKVREKSYVHDTPTRKGSNSLYTTYRHYNLSIDEACSQVCEKMGLDKQHFTLANLLLFSCWNDALDWADTQLYPVEMAYVEACYSVSSGMVNKYFTDKNIELSREQVSELSTGFVKSAKEVRKSLYSFGEAVA